MEENHTPNDGDQGTAAGNSALEASSTMTMDQVDKTWKIDMAVTQVMEVLEDAKKAEQEKIELQTHLEVANQENTRLRQLVETSQQERDLAIRADEEARQELVRVQAQADIELANVESEKLAAIAQKNKVEKDRADLELWSTAQIDGAIRTGEAAAKRAEVAEADKATAHEHARSAKEEMSQAIEAARREEQTRVAAVQRAEEALAAATKAEERANEAQEAMIATNMRVLELEKSRTWALSVAQRADESRVEMEQRAERSKQEISEELERVRATAEAAIQRAERAEQLLTAGNEIVVAAPSEWYGSKEKRKRQQAKAAIPRGNKLQKHNSPKAIERDHPLNNLAQQVQSAIESWKETETERLIYIGLKDGSIVIQRTDEESAELPDYLVIQCVLDAGELTVAMFQIMSIARKLRGRDLTADESCVFDSILKPYAFRKISGRHSAELFGTGQRFRWVQLYRWNDLVNIITAIWEEIVIA